VSVFFAATARHARALPEVARVERRDFVICAIHCQLAMFTMKWAISASWTERNASLCLWVRVQIHLNIYSDAVWQLPMTQPRNDSPSTGK